MATSLRSVAFAVVIYDALANESTRDGSIERLAIGLETYAACRAEELDIKSRATLPQIDSLLSEAD